MANTTRLYIAAVDAPSMLPSEPTLVGLLATVVVDIFNVKGVDVAGDIAEKREADVDKQICKKSN